MLASHDRWLRTVVYARVGEVQAVDEVMQEVSLAAVRQQAPINDVEKITPWLYRLAVTHSLLYRRKQGRRRKLIDRFVQRTQPSEYDRETDPLEWLLAKERKEQIRKAMKRMPKRDAEILLLEIYGRLELPPVGRPPGHHAKVRLKPACIVPACGCEPSWSNLEVLRSNHE